VQSSLLIDRARAPHATLVLAHGAGLPMDAPFMKTLASELSARGVSVVRFEFPYMQRLREVGRRAPPNPMHVLEARFREVVASLDEPAPLFIGGKSLGGRVATRVADSLEVRGVVALGYPFHPAKRPDKLRLEHLAELRAPCLIVQGTRDPLGNREEVARYELSTSIRVHWLEDGDHSFEPRRASGRSLVQNMAAAVEAVVAFTQGC